VQVAPDGGGAPIEKRPSCGASLVPSLIRCENIYTNEQVIEKWIGHQKVLQKLVRNYANCSVEEQIKLDIINARANIYLELKRCNGNISELSDESKNIITALNFLYPLYKEEILQGTLKGKTLELKRF
jgi:hypothetical protein